MTRGPVDLRGAEVGERWVVRHRLPDGSATDTVGWVQEVTTAEVSLADLAGQVRTVPVATVVLARRAPAAMGGPDPRRLPADELERITLPGWLAGSEPLGGWTLRAGGGFTGRANSCLAVGDPQVPLPEAAGRIVAYAAEHQIAPMAQVVEGSDADDGLRGLGWVTTYEATDVLVARLADFLEGRGVRTGVEVSETLDDRWRTAYRQSRPHHADPTVLEAILGGHPPRAFAGRAGPDPAVLVAIARGSLNAGWLGLASIWTDPDHRRRGLATAAMTALGHWAARQGARYVYLQVAVANRPAHRAYARLGFASHHTYGYLKPPG